jgi:hypothetical protein
MPVTDGLGAEGQSTRAACSNIWHKNVQIHTKTCLCCSLCLRCACCADMCRGLRTALVEGEDFAAGTSGRSTKLVHGGVRYLEKAVWNLDIGARACLVCLIDYLSIVRGYACM